MLTPLDKKSNLTYHELDVNGYNVTLDGLTTNVSINHRKEEMIVGCTHISFKALQRLFDMYTHARLNEEVTLQGGNT